MANLRENYFSSTATFFKPYSYTLHISVSFVLLLMNVLAKQPVDCFSEDLKRWEAWDTIPAEVLRNLRHSCRHKAKDITLLIAWRREAWKEEALDNLPWKDERGPSAIKQTLEQFQRQHQENLWETHWNAHGLFWAHRYYLELNWWRNSERYGGAVPETTWKQMRAILSVLNLAVNW